MRSLPKQMQESYYNGLCRIQRVTINLITHVDMNSTLYCLSIRRTFNSIQHLLTLSIQYSALSNFQLSKSHLILKGNGKIYSLSQQMFLPQSILVFKPSLWCQKKSFRNSEIKYVNIFDSQQKMIQTYYYDTTQTSTF